MSGDGDCVLFKTGEMNKDLPVPGFLALPHKHTHTHTHTTHTLLLDVAVPWLKLPYALLHVWDNFSSVSSVLSFPDFCFN